MPPYIFTKPDGDYLDVNRPGNNSQMLIQEPMVDFQLNRDSYLIWKAPFETAEKAFTAAFKDGIHKIPVELQPNMPRCMSAKGASTLFGYDLHEIVIEVVVILNLFCVIDVRKTSM